MVTRYLSNELKGILQYFIINVNLPLNLNLSESQGGISFILLFYTSLNETYYIPFKDIKRFYDRSINGGRKSFRYEEIDKNYLIKSAPGALVHYLEGIQKDLDSREG